MTEAQQQYEAKMKEIELALQRLQSKVKNADSDGVHWGHVGSASEALNLLKQVFQHI